MNQRWISLALFATTWLAAVAFEDGDLSSWDTANRLQVTRWIWTDAPQVLPEQTWFGVYGKDGKKYAWTGLGQSLWMLPSQILGSQLAPRISSNPKYANKFEEIFVTYTVFPLTSALAVVALFHLLLALQFCERTAGLAAMAGFWGTSLFPYTQINQENSLIFLFATLSFLFAIKVHQEEQKPWWYMALGCCLGYNLLVRLTTGIDAICVGLLFLVLQPAPFLLGLKRRAPGLLLAVGCGLIFVLIERAYHYHRFGSLINTYVDVIKSQRLDVLPEGDFGAGISGLLWSVQNNVWQFDPLAAFALVAVPLVWGGLTSRQKKMSLITILYASLYILFYASRPFFDGDSAWGSRYTTSPIILMGVLGVATVLESSKTWLKKVMIPVTVLAIVIQLSSTFFWYSLEEIQQKDHKGVSKSMVVLRAQNIAAYWTGRWKEWDLLAEQDSLRQRTPNYFPFLIRKYLDSRVAKMLAFSWLTCVAIALSGNLILLFRLIIKKPYEYRTKN